MHPEGNCRICLTCHDKATPRPPRDGIAPAQWRDKGDSLYMPMDHAAYLAKPDYNCSEKDLTPSTAPRHDDPLTRHQLSYRFLPPSGGALDVLVVAHPDAEAVCERMEPFDQRGLRLAGFGALAELGHQGGEGLLGRRPGCLRVLLHRSMSAPNRAGSVFLDERPAIRFADPQVGGLSGCWNTMADSKPSALYYSPRGYWKGLAAIEKLASAAKVTEQQAKDWLKRQAIWQIYLPAPRRVPRS